jgi:peptidoglycan hydrolase-like protein with peptidoglycan-binding domain
MAPLTSQLFAQDQLLQDIADDVNGVRISRSANSRGPSVGRVQQALLIWDPAALPQHGADEDYGNETAQAVRRFKVEELGVPAAEVIDDVGPRTVQRLDEMALASELLPLGDDDGPVPAELIEAVDLAAPALMALPGVNGFAPAVAFDGDQVTGEPAVYVVVSDESDVPEGIPAEIGGVAVTILEGRPVPLVDETRYSNLKGGIKVVHPSERGAGTMGVVVRDNATREPLGLSNQHVVGSPGGTFPQVVWQPVEPPGIHVHTGGPVPPGDVVGAVTKAEFPRTIPGVGGSLVSDADAAVFKLDLALAQPAPDTRTVSPAVVAATQGADLIAKVTAVAEPSPVTFVRKRGFRTELTHGIVLSNHARSKWFEDGSQPQRWLVEQAFVIGRTNNPGDVFADHGDSGSLLLDEGSATALGLVWGRIESAKTGRGGKFVYASKMRTVELRLGVTAAWA